MNIETSSCKDVYKNVIKLKKEHSKAIQRYIDIFPSLEEADIETMFILPRLCTEDNVLKEFQYKLLIWILPTNNLLFKMGKNNTNQCSFCNMYIEDIFHEFYDSLIVKNVWCVVEICLSS